MGPSTDRGPVRRNVAYGSEAHRRAEPAAGPAAAIRWLPGGLRSAGARRARWGMADQAVSSLTNFALTAVVAHQVAPAEFGSFSVALAVYIFVLWAARSVAAEPFLVRMTTAPATIRTASARAALGAAVVIGAASGAVMVAAGLVVGSRSGAPLVAMGVVMPGLLAQDTYRYILMASGRVRATAANDGVWLIVQSALFVSLLLGGHAHAVGLVAAFGASATIAGVVGSRQAAARPSLALWWKWLRTHRDLGVPFVLELVAVNGAPQWSILGVAALGGIVAAGELRAAALLLSAPTVLCSAFYLIGMPEAVRLRHRSLHGLTVLVVTLAVSMSLFVLGWTVALLLLPSSVGESLLRSNWSHGRHLLIPMAFMTAASSVVIAAVVGLRALEAARQSLRIRIWVGPIILVSALVGAAASGGYGAAVGLALSSWLNAVLALVVYWRAVTEATLQTSGGQPDVGTMASIPESFGPQ